MKNIKIKHLVPTVYQVQDAQATMRLYTLEKKKWESDIKASHNNKDSDKKRVRKPKSSKNKNVNVNKNLVGF